MTNSEACGNRPIGLGTKESPLLASALAAETARPEAATQLENAQHGNALRRILAAVLPFIVIGGFFSCAGAAFGQTKPDNAVASVDSTGVHVKISACQSDAYGTDQTKTNCYNFGIYRSPTPGFDKQSIGTAYLVNSSVIPFTDPDSANLKVGQAYSYRVCTNIFPNSGGSNCFTTNTITIPAKIIDPPPFVTLTGSAVNIPYGSQISLSWTSANAYKLELSSVGKVPGPSGSMQVNPPATQTYTITATRSDGKQATANFTVNVFCPTPTVPGTVDASGGPSGIGLKWTNPNTAAGKWCPVSSNQVLIYRLGPETNQFQLVATLPKANGVLPSHYLDKGPFQPHMGYLYEVCEVGPPDWLNPYDCATPREPVVSWGANPVLTATRINSTTIRLRLNLDQNTFSSVVITRQGSDDPCRQGQTLGNGLQGCSSNPITLAQNTPVIYDWTATPLNSVAPGFEHPLTPPFVIDIPDDSTVHPAAEYWYQTAVVWLGTLEQDAAMVTVPSFYATAGTKAGLLGGGTQPIKLNGHAPAPPPSGSSVAAAPSIRTVTATSPSAMIRPAATASVAPARQSVTAAQTMMAPMMRPATPMLRPGQPMMGSTGAPAAPAITPPATAVRSTMAPTKQSAPSVLQKVGVLPGGASRIGGVPQKPQDAQTLFALGKAYCGKNLKDTCASYMYLALAVAQSSGNTSLVKQIKASLGTR